MAADAKASAGDFLAAMAAASRVRADAAQAVASETQLRREIEARRAPAALMLRDTGFDLIAEIKKRSPAAGALADDRLSPAAQAEAYRAGGAAALSVLTEPEQFRGRLDDLRAVAAVAGGIPAMRKDFLVSPYQVLEARAAGAAGVLLIAAMLDRAALAELLAEALALEMFALVEVFDARELEHCLPVLEAAGAPVDEHRCRILLGVNCRDLRTLNVEFGRFAELAPMLPPGLPAVAESGITVPRDAATVAGLGYRFALVGSALMRSAYPGIAVNDLVAAGRAAA